MNVRRRRAASNDMGKGSMNRTTPQKSIQMQVLELKREAILSAAGRLFYEKGYSATTLDVVAAEVGLSKPAIYDHFNSKQAILNSLYYRTMDVTLAAFEDFDQDRYTPTEGLRELVIRFVDVVIDSREGVGFFWRGDTDIPQLDKKRAREFRRDFEGIFLSVIGRGVETGEFRVADTSLAMTCIEGMINWIYIWYREDGRLSADEVASEMSQLVLNMVGAQTR